MTRPLDELDRRLVLATQAGLPLVSRPYEALGRQLGCPAEEVIARLQGLLDRGMIRRVGAVPNHYAIGYTANGMSVWDIDDRVIDAVGERVGGLIGVTHCYRRPRHPPGWNYNLFAMVHGKSRDEVMRQVEEIAELIGQEFGTACRAHDVLFSSVILKKSGLRLSA
ncbi:MAG: Lrp/AsnC family transcriptional regulator [Bacteroidota bacterium]